MSNDERIAKIERDLLAVRVKQDFPIGGTVNLVAKVTNINESMREIRLEVIAPCGGVVTPILFRFHHMYKD